MRATLSEARAQILCSFAILCLAIPSAAQAPDLDALIGRVMSTHRFSEVQISPDGKRVAWVESTVRNDNEYAHAVYTADARPGANPGKLDVPGSRNQFGIAWSPDSKELAFLAETDSPEHIDLRIAAPDGTQSKSLSSLSGDLSAVRWSPDGRTISLLCSFAD
ncbi:MAG: PD40 domain-containing protein [Acidobacteriaceae bacterium]|nr:PD40 domain-containing protein [Acidobacteriaceae bacterium]